MTASEWACHAVLIKPRLSTSAIEAGDRRIEMFLIIIDRKFRRKSTFLEKNTNIRNPSAVNTET